MHPLLFAILASAAAAQVIRDGYGGVSGPRTFHNPIVECVCTDRNPVCRPVDYRYCQSGDVRKCGCCDVCYEYLEEGEMCEGNVPKSAICRPPLICGSTSCQLPGRQRPGF